jgi:hypothetical protein
VPQTTFQTFSTTLQFPSRGMADPQPGEPLRSPVDTEINATGAGTTQGATPAISTQPAIEPDPESEVTPTTPLIHWTEGAHMTVDCRAGNRLYIWRRQVRLPSTPFSPSALHPKRWSRSGRP